MNGANRREKQIAVKAGVLVQYRVVQFKQDFNREAGAIKLYGVVINAYGRLGPAKGQLFLCATANAVQKAFVSKCKYRYGVGHRLMPYARRAVYGLVAIPDG